MSADAGDSAEGTAAAGSGVEEAVDPAAGAETAIDVEIVDHAAKPVSGGVHTTAELMDSLLGTAADAPMCFTCGTKMRPGRLLLRLRRLRQHQGCS